MAELIERGRNTGAGLAVQRDGVDAESDEHGAQAIGPGRRFPEKDRGQGEGEENLQPHDDGEGAAQPDQEKRGRVERLAQARGEEAGQAQAPEIVQGERPERVLRS